MRFFSNQLALVQRRTLLAGSTLLFVSTFSANAGNYVSTLVMARWLGPDAFADANLIFTLPLLLSFATMTFTLTTAKFSAEYTAQSDLFALSSLRHWLIRRALLVGASMTVLFALGAPLLANGFHIGSAWPFLIFSVGLPMFVAQSVDRGVLQGQIRFGLLALSYQIEMWTRLLLIVLFIALGWSVNGAVGALSLSFLAAWLSATSAGRTLPSPSPLTTERARTILKFSGPLVANLLGQVLINNSDVVIVKRFFTTTEAGQYAVLAIIGRIVFFATWSIAMVLIPVAAQKHIRGETHRYLLSISLAIVTAVSAVIILLSLAAPIQIVDLLFGSAYEPIAPLLWFYALATALYTLSNVIVNYWLSIGRSGGGILVLIASFMQVIILWLVHHNVWVVVLVQIVVMTGLLGALLVWDRYLLLRVTGKV
jgi:O-antigen/teichoic acid export membrane protein